MTPANKRGGEYTGMKASKDTSSLLSRLILFVQIAQKRNHQPTTREFRDSEGCNGEKTIALAVRKGWIVLKRKGNARVIELGPNYREIETLYQILSNDPDVR